MPAAELLTPAEAAVVADVPLRAVNRVIDEEILPKKFVRLEGGRRVSSVACAFIRFYERTAPRLTAEERRRVIRLAGKGAASVFVDDVLTINFDPFFAETLARHEKLKRARALVVEDPAILSGAPVLRGTRIPVHDVAAAVAAGEPLERIRRAYSNLTDEQIELASLYAEANPPRGRPKLASRRPGAMLVADRVVPRRRP